MSIGLAIRRVRERANLTQAELAKACGWPVQSRVSMYENNKREPLLGDLLAIARVCGVSPIELLADGLGQPIPQRDRSLADVNTQRLLRAFEGLPPATQLQVVGIVEALAAPGQAQLTGPASKPANTRRGRPPK